MGYCGDHPMSVKSFRSGISTQCHAICRWSWGFVGRLKTAILIFNLFSGRWINTQQLATRSGSFFGQAQAVNTNHVWSQLRQDWKCRTKCRTSTRIKPSEKWQIKLRGRIGTHTPNSLIFIFSQMESRRLKQRSRTLNKSPSGNLPGREGFSGLSAA